MEGPRPLEVNLPFGRLVELKDREASDVVGALTYSKEGLKVLLGREEKLTEDVKLFRLLLATLAKVRQD